MKNNEPNFKDLAEHGYVTITSQSTMTQTFPEQMKNRELLAMLASIAQGELVVRLPPKKSAPK